MQVGSSQRLILYSQRVVLQRQRPVLHSQRPVPYVQLLMNAVEDTQDIQNISSKSGRCDGFITGANVWYSKIRVPVSSVVRSKIFNWSIAGALILNIVVISMETASLNSPTLPVYLLATEGVFLFIYILEFSLKVFVDPVKYWLSYYNIFDAIVLLVVVVHLLLAVAIDQPNSLAFRIILAFRSFYTLRSISFLRGLQILVSTLVAILKTALLNLVLLLLVLMFLFAIMGYYFFGFMENDDKENWGTFGRAMLSLFTYVTAERWYTIQNDLSAHGFQGSEAFTIVFIFLGHFLFTNIFIGVIVSNIHTATLEIENHHRAEKEAFIQSKKHDMVTKQHKEVLQLLEQQKASNFADFDEMTSDFQKTLQHEDFVHTKDLCTTVQWMETLLLSLEHLEISKTRCQHLRYKLLDEQQLTREEPSIDITTTPPT